MNKFISEWLNMEYNIPFQKSYFSVKVSYN